MNRSFLALFSSALFLLPACVVTAEDLDVEGDTAAATTAAAARIPAGRGVAGSWRSPSCGDRPHARALSLGRDGRFEAQDLIAPCPPGAYCFWSGIVITTGTYTVDADSIDLTIAAQEPRSLDVHFPTSLAIDRATSAPVEIPRVRGEQCVYTRSVERGGRR